MTKKSKLGTGGRAAALRRKVVAEYLKKGYSKARAEKIAGGVIGKVGRKKYGKKRMVKWSVAGRKRSKRKK